MGYDSIAKVSIQSVASNAKDFGKKKRVNRTAKLKQSKLDVRREQWLSHVKNKGCKEEINDDDSGGGVKMPAPVRPVGELEINHGGEGNEGSKNHYSDSESPSNSPVSHSSSVSVSEFSGISGLSSSSSSGGCCSESMTEEDDGLYGCLDDWEAIADALEADDIKTNSPEAPNLETLVVQLDSILPEPEGAAMAGQDTLAQAWRPDDVFRPQTLPNLLKQNSFPMNLEGHHGHYGFKNASSPPSTCPICCEDLDLTDSSFLPCLCGYRLCLFCHKRILEDDGRCPGCRKPYDHHDHVGPGGSGGSSLKMASSYSTINRP